VSQDLLEPGVTAFEQTFGVRLIPNTTIKFVYDSGSRMGEERQAAFVEFIDLTKGSGMLCKNVGNPDDPPTGLRRYYLSGVTSLSVPAG
jgi:hypothetical protein